MPDTLFSSQIARATLLQAEGDHEAALQSLREAADQAYAEFGSSDNRLAVALEQQVAVLRALGRQRQAEDVLQQATKVRMKNTRQSGRALEAQQKYDEAEKLFREALRVSEKAYGQQHRETATCLDNLATCLRKQGHYIDAVTYCSRSLEIREAVLGKKHAHTATSYCNLGFLYRTLGRYDEAQTLLAQSLSVREQSLGGQHPYVAESLDRLAGLCRDRGQYEEAARLCERGLKIRREALGEDHPLTAASLNNLALCREERSSEAAGGLRLPANQTSDPRGQPADLHGSKTSQSSQQSHKQKAGSTLGGRWKPSMRFLLATGLILGVAGSALAFWLLPAAGVAAAVVVILLGIGSVSKTVSIEPVVLRVGGFLHSRFVQETASARDRVFLGEIGDSQTLKLGRGASGTVLTSRHAKALARLDHVDLDHVSVLTLAAADELGRHRGTLKLNGIKAVRSKLARALGHHSGCLQLNGATLVTPSATAYLCLQTGDLHLNGLTEITTEHAANLAHHTGVLQLNGLRTLDEEAASWLIRHKGPLTLLGLKLVSRQTVRLLRTNTAIQLPPQLGEGI